MSGPVTSQALLYKCCINQLLTWIILTAILQYQWLSWMIFLLILMHLAILNSLVETVTVLRYDCKSLVGWTYKIKYQKQVSPKSFLSKIYSITHLVSHTLRFLFNKIKFINLICYLNSYLNQDNFILHAKQKFL